MAAAVPTFHVLGAGAMGCLLAASIAKHGRRVTLLTRPRQQRQQQQAAPGGPSDERWDVIRMTETYRGSGSSSSGGGGRSFDYEARVAVEENDPRAALPPIARLLVLTKAYDAHAALTALAPRLAPDAVVVLLSNGMGHYEEIRAEPRLAHVSRWLLGTTTHGALLLPPPPTPTDATDGYYHVSHTGRGETFLGLPPLPSVADPAESLAALQTVLSELTPASDALGLDPTSPEHAATATAEGSAALMGRRLWMKLAANACINPLTALTRRRNGAVVEEPGLQPLIAALCTEAAAVARALSSSSSQPLPDAAEFEAYVRRVAEQTAQNESSMLRDMLHGRRTEIDYINGYIAREARRLNQHRPKGEEPLRVPTHEMLLGLVQAAEKSGGGGGVVG